jgi:hypothetical protein
LRTPQSPVSNRKPAPDRATESSPSRLCWPRLSGKCRDGKSHEAAKPQRNRMDASETEHPESRLPASSRGGLPCAPTGQPRTAQGEALRGRTRPAKPCWPHIPQRPCAALSGLGHDAVAGPRGVAPGCRVIWKLATGHCAPSRPASNLNLKSSNSGNWPGAPHPAPPSSAA